ncbi:MAG: hypothetical protein HYS22_06135 [Deltaproteobacteria bacterium]|nr:hypothetical protein [Deltaproteobacteria bacterium]
MKHPGSAVAAAFLFCSPAPLFAVDFSAHGYYRNRTVTFHDLDTQQPNSGVAQPGLGDKPCKPDASQAGQPGDNDCFGSILFNQHRLRVEPMLKVNDNISFHMQMDIVDNLIFGTEKTKQLDFVSPIVGTVQLPGSGGALGVVGGEAGENKVLHIRRAWVNLLTPMGVFRFGRQPSHWGLGIFQNDGNGIEDDFGDTFDRILYLAALDTEKAGTFSFGTVADITFANQRDPRISGLGGAIRGVTEDMRQFAGILMYEKEGENAAFSLGTFSGIRYRNGKEGDTTTTARRVLDADNNGIPDLDASGNSQLTDPLPAGHDGNTFLYFADIYTKLKFLRHYKIQLEYVYLGGKLSTGLAIDAVPFNNLPANALGPYELADQNKFQVHMAAMEAEANYDFGEFLLQSGFASGDSDPLSSKITQFGFRPDYQLGLLMFHVPLGRSPSITQANGNGQGSRLLVGGVPVTGNFINNTIYTALGYKHHLNIQSLIPKSRDVKAGVKVITGWTHQSNFNIDFSEITGIQGLPRVTNSKRWYGIEVDSSLEGRFFDFLLARLDTGFLLPGSAYDVDVNVFDPGNLSAVNTIPFDGANWAFGLRGTIAVEF